MKNKKTIINCLIVISAIIIIGLLYYILFFNKPEKTNPYFNLYDHNIELKVGTKRLLNYVLSDNKYELVWSSNNDIVTVSKDGEIYAKDYGKSTITGIVNVDGEIVTNTCTVTTYTGEIGVQIKEITTPEGFLMMRPNSEYDLPFAIEPYNAYVTSINYSSDDVNYVTVENNKIISKNEGSANIHMVVNGRYVGKILVVVSNSIDYDQIVKKVEKFSLEPEIIMEVGDTEELIYTIEPENGYVENIEWYSSNNNIVTVDDGKIKAVNMGQATIKAIVNNNIESETIVNVKSTTAEVRINTNPKNVIKVGETTSIKASISPVGVNDNIIYKSSNPMVASINNGTITGISPGSAIITLSISNGKTKSLKINVLPMNGSMTGSANFWGYKSLNERTPVIANKYFYQSLAQNGTGILQNNLYVISTGTMKFTYDISSSILTAGGKKIKLRIFYPIGVDLSMTNTLTFMGGRGETNFDGLFKKIEENPTIVKSAGILALVAEGKNTAFDGDAGAYVTKFVKAITRQKAGVKNSILGFSDGANKVLHASKNETYDKIIVFSGYTDGASGLNNAKNSEVLIMIAPNDGNYSQAKSLLRSMKESGYKNVTIVSNGTELIKQFSDKFLVIIPGSLMKNAHDTINILNSGIIAYAND